MYGGLVGDWGSDCRGIGTRDLGAPAPGDHLEVARLPGVLFRAAGRPVGILYHGITLLKTSDIVFGKDDPYQRIFQESGRE